MRWIPCLMRVTFQIEEEAEWTFHRSMDGMDRINSF
jgi:hypothetical protein